MVFQRDFRRVLDLLRRAAENRAQSRGGHRGRGSDLGLAAAFRSGNRGVALDDAADGRGDKKEIGDLIAPRGRHVVEEILDRRGNDARRSVGRRGHDLTSARVFLVHRHCVDRNPVVDGVRRGQIVSAFLHQRFMNRACAPLHAEAAGKNAVSRQSSAYASAHRVPNGFDSVFDFIRCSNRELVGAHQRRDVQPALARLLEQTGGIPEWERHFGSGGAGMLRAEFGACRDKPAACGIVYLLNDHVVLIVQRGKCHPVRVTGQSVAVSEFDIFGRIEAKPSKAVRRYRTLRRNQRESRLRFFGVVRFGSESRETESYGSIGRMAAPGECKRSVQRHAQGPRREVAVSQQVEKSRSGDHRSECVRTRRPDANFEYIEDAEEH